MATLPKADSEDDSIAVTCQFGSESPIDLDDLPSFCACVLTARQDYFKKDTLALIGYGSQGHGQGLNLRDNGLNVIVGVRKNGKSWKDAVQDGWVPGKNLFDVDEAIGRGTIIMNLLSDAAQSETWPAIKPQIVKGKVRLPTPFLSLSTLVDQNLMAEFHRPCTSPTASPPFSRTSPKWRSPPTSMSSSAPPRALAALFDLSSVRAVASTPPLPSSRT